MTRIGRGVMTLIWDEKRLIIYWEQGTGRMYWNLEFWTFQGSLRHRTTPQLFLWWNSRGTCALQSQHMMHGEIKARIQSKIKARHRYVKLYYLSYIQRTNPSETASSLSRSIRTWGRTYVRIASRSQSKLAKSPSINPRSRHVTAVVLRNVSSIAQHC
jgi:hypothetical protein